jgi:hypothetical protein
MPCVALRLDRRDVDGAGDAAKPTKWKVAAVSGAESVSEAVRRYNEMAFCCERLTNIAASERQRARRLRNHLRSSAATPG